MSARRAVLAAQARTPDTHAGLWLDKFLSEQTTDTSTDEQRAAKGRLLKEVAELKAPGEYKLAYERSEPTAGPGQVLRLGVAKSLGRTVLGLGQKGPTEIGITLEHTWGVPVLPGSALKGLAAAAAHQLFGGRDWEKRERVGDEDLTSFEWLFGTTSMRGAVEFHDAWWVPNDKPPLELDVMTVHHPDYYAKGAVAPADTDSPNPISFLTTSGSFRVALSGADAWVDVAWELLEAGLAELGIGAKTNAGYGRMGLERLRTAAERQAEELKHRWAALLSLPARLRGAGNATDLFREVMKAAADGCPDSVLVEVCAKLATDAQRKMWKDWAKKDSRKPEELAFFKRYFALG